MQCITCTKTMVKTWHLWSIFNYEKNILLNHYSFLKNWFIFKKIKLKLIMFKWNRLYLILRQNSLHYVTQIELIVGWVPASDDFYFLLFIMNCFKNIIITFGLECLRIFISSVINWFELLWCLRCAGLILEMAIFVHSLPAIFIWCNPLWVSITHPPSPLSICGTFISIEKK